MTPRLFCLRRCNCRATSRSALDEPRGVVRYRDMGASQIVVCRFRVFGVEWMPTPFGIFFFDRKAEYRPEAQSELSNPPARYHQPRYPAVFPPPNRGKERFICPVCGYKGPLRDVDAPSGLRKHAQCPRWNALERPLYTGICNGAGVHAARRAERRSAVAF